jgi:hypothetical protein
MQSMAKELDKIGVDVPFLSILTPYRGTALYAKMRNVGRLREELGWEFYNGYNVSFTPRKMSLSIRERVGPIMHGRVDA